MKKIDSVITYVDYGQVECNLKEVMEKKSITKTQLVKNTGLHHRVIERYMDNNTIRYDKDVLAKLCYVLDCELSDIIHYIRPEK